MVEMTNPLTALISYQAAYKEGRIRPQACPSPSDLVVLMDKETGPLRVSYALIEHGVVKGIAIFIAGPHIDQIPLFDIGYAVDENFRCQGVATKVMEQSISEMRAGFGRHIPRFYLQAVIGTTNVASQKVAARIFGSSPKPITDSVSGQPALAYLRLIECR
ncbi:GNAT family N-acetyltransferase [Burkholderia sp. PAMC 26561]|uniref:GNAT family N-acetyltransferase n=1 Tax=Burkholderia sp. PAMC 26561 TaxID=1795043 RepID=UPI00076B372B|nr:GNAT family N-acetyltransferase [Burkholderia sp. PAMC 26561]AME28657.1 hypothetical protein AXG89_33245 [Burkholderia sp. PAMC 26561]